MVVPIKNSSCKALEVQLEPWLDIVLLQPGEKASLQIESGNAIGQFSLEYDDRECLVLHVSEKATLSKDI